MSKWASTPTANEVARVLAWEMGADEGYLYAQKVSAQMGSDSHVYRQAADLLKPQTSGEAAALRAVQS